MNCNIDWTEIFKKNKLKVTKGRLLVARELEKASQPISAEDVFMTLKQQGEKIDLSTVYRTLETLEQNKIIKKISFSGDEKKMYAVESDIHSHYLICNSCHKIITIKKCPITAYEKELKKEMGFEVEEHSLSLYGICRECSENKK